MDAKRSGSGIRRKAAETRKETQTAPKKNARGSVEKSQKIEEKEKYKGDKAEEGGERHDGVGEYGGGNGGVDGDVDSDVDKGGDLDKRGDKHEDNDGDIDKHEDKHGDENGNNDADKHGNNDRDKDKDEEVKVNRKIEELSQKIKIIGRDKEVKTVLSYVFGSDREELYIYGKPGSGKTHSLKAITEHLDSEDIEIYYTNMLIDTEYFQIGKKKSKNILLVTDEFEGNNRSREQINQKNKLYKKWRKEKRQLEEITIKNIFIGNVKYKEGIHFHPYSRAEIEKILEEKEKQKTAKKGPKEAEEKIERLRRIQEGVERADLRASLQKKIKYAEKNASPAPYGQYHQFVRRKIDEGVVDIGILYKEFIAEMKRKDLPVVARELFKEIYDSYMEGAN